MDLVNLLYGLLFMSIKLIGFLYLIKFGFSLKDKLDSSNFFIIAGIAQIFWVIPMLKKWGRTWYYIGIAGTIILIIIWAITRMPGNPITGRGGPISEMAIAVEIFQVAYVIITAIILVKERRK